MIVISGALVLVALVLLVIGVVTDGLNLVYGSIGVSLLALLALFIGILQRRSEPVPASGSSADAPADSAAGQDATSGAADGSTSEASSAAATAVAARPVAVEQDEPGDEIDEEELEYGGTVLVVGGRPRYHVEGCRYITGRDAEEIDVLDARDEGFTPCGVCRPDDALAQDAQDRGPEDGDDEDQDAADQDNDVPADEPDAEPQRTPAVTSSRRSGLEVAASPAKTGTAALTAGTTAARKPATVTASTGKASSGKTGQTKADASKTGASKTGPSKTGASKTGATKTGATKTGASKTVPSKTARPGRVTTAPGKAPAAKTPAGKAAPATTPPGKARAGGAPTASRAATVASKGTAASTEAATRKGSVVVIPDRGKYHRAECRYVRGVADAEVLTKAQAARQGYEQCGVCTP